jgi:hypothetical protein
MTVSQELYKDGKFTSNELNDPSDPKEAGLVLCFGERLILSDPGFYELMISRYPSAQIMLCSTAGEILAKYVYDDTVSITAITFDKTKLKSTSVNIKGFSDSFQAGKDIMKALDADDLAYVLILSDGSIANGSQLVLGMEESNRRKVPITGGMAGDGVRFEKSVVGLNGPVQAGTIAAMGFYGKDLVVTHSSMGGWDMFGPERTVTKSIDNKLFGIDNRSALDLYKIYLGKHVNELPGAALLFPLSVKLPGHDIPLVRTILSIDPEDDGMVFSGDVPQGSLVRFMKANFDKLVGAAAIAADHNFNELSHRPPKLALLISCVGRKIILDKRIEEEVESVADIFGESTFLTGFYSYGEISPLMKCEPCQLHNQTMTITTLDES